MPVDSLIGAVSGRDVCEVSGTLFDIGMAFRADPKSPFARITLFGARINDGSATFYTCEECGKQVQVVAQGVNAAGVKVDGIFPLTYGAVRPMIFVQGGVGKFSGKTVKTSLSASGVYTT